MESQSNPTQPNPEDKITIVAAARYLLPRSLGSQYQYQDQSSYTQHPARGPPSSYLLSIPLPPPPPTMDRDQVLSTTAIRRLIASGKHIVISEGRVLQLDGWLDKHPGGRLAIKHMVGRDATNEINM